MHLSFQDCLVIWGSTLVFIGFIIWCDFSNRFDKMDIKFQVFEEKLIKSEEKLTQRIGHEVKQLDERLMRKIENEVKQLTHKIERLDEQLTHKIEYDVKHLGEKLTCRIEHLDGQLIRKIEYEIKHLDEQLTKKIEHEINSSIGFISQTKQIRPVDYEK